jgi:hypothetical protein
MSKKGAQHTARTPNAKMQHHSPLFLIQFRRRTRYLESMEIVFSVTQEPDGGFFAECLSHDLFTQGDTWEELRGNVIEATTAFFFDQPKPAAFRLHLVRDEVLAVAGPVRIQSNC